MWLVSNYVSDAIATWLWIALLAADAVALGWLFSTTRQTWAGVAAYVAGMIAILLLLLTQFELAGIGVPVLVLLAIAAPFFLAWLRNREEKGWLIPAYIMTAIALGLLGMETGLLPEEALPAYTMFAVGLPFIVAFFNTRQWGFLIPGGIMVIIGIGLLISVSEEAISMFVALALIVVGVIVLFMPRRKAKREEGAEE